MTTPTALALVNGLLTPNLRNGLPFMIMLLMIQGIHPEIIFELIPHVIMSQQQYDAIIMAWTQLRLFSSLLPAVKGVKSKSFRDQRGLFRTFPQDRISRIFVNFQNEVLSRMLKKFGFFGLHPSLEVVQKLAENLVVVRTSRCPIFPPKVLLLSPDADLILLKTALQMQSMIEHVRSSYPEIISFLAQQNENALKNIIMVWRNQVSVNQIVYRSLFNMHEPARIHSLFIFCIVAATRPEFIDENLAQFIQNCGDQNKTMQFSYDRETLKFLEENCETFEPMTLQLGDIGRVIELFSSMLTSTTRPFQVRYELRPWSIGFGQIRHSGCLGFEEVIVEQGSYELIFDVFTRFWDLFFRNFALTFAVSFLPFGNILWSEGYTHLIQTNFDWIIQIVVGNFAFRIGALDDHAFLKSQPPSYRHTNITSTSYGMFIFPYDIRDAVISEEICSCFLRDFWLAHRKPDLSMSDIDYIRWLFSIPGTFAIFGKSWIELMDALQNGTELSRIQDGSSGDFRYLSCPTVETDPKVQQSYDEIFGEYFRQMGREIEISDYAEGGSRFHPGGTAVPPLPPHAPPCLFEKLQILAIIGKWIG
jgi:hypothetical protein